MTPSHPNPNRYINQPRMGRPGMPPTGIGGLQSLIEPTFGPGAMDGTDGYNHPGMGQQPPFNAAGSGQMPKFGMDGQPPMMPAGGIPGMNPSFQPGGKMGQPSIMPPMMPPMMGQPGRPPMGHPGMRNPRMPQGILEQLRQKKMGGTPNVPAGTPSNNQWEQMLAEISANRMNQPGRPPMIGRSPQMPQMMPPGMIRNPNYNPDRMTYDIQNEFIPANQSQDLNSLLAMLSNGQY